MAKTKLTDPETGDSYEGGGSTTQNTFTGAEASGNSGPNLYSIKKPGLEPLPDLNPIEDLGRRDPLKSPYIGLSRQVDALNAWAPYHMGNLVMTGSAGGTVNTALNNRSQWNKPELETEESRLQRDTAEVEKQLQQTARTLQMQMQKDAQLTEFGSVSQLRMAQKRAISGLEQYLVDTQNFAKMKLTKAQFEMWNRTVGFEARNMLAQLMQTTYHQTPQNTAAILSAANNPQAFLAMEGRAAVMNNAMSTFQTLMMMYILKLVLPKDQAAAFDADLQRLNQQ